MGRFVVVFSLFFLATMAGVRTHVVDAGSPGFSEFRGLSRAATELDRLNSVPDADSLLGPTQIVVLNPKAQPVVGGTWDIEFILTGKADLQIEAVAPTTLSFGGVSAGTSDVVFRWLRAGFDSVAVTGLEGGGVRVPGFSHQGICRLSVRVQTLGRHRLSLRFGSSRAIADNSALATFTTVGTGTTSLDTNTGNSMVFADLNGDGYPDMAKSDDGGGGGDIVRVELNNQNETFTAVTGITTQSYRGIAAGDVDGDGDTDLVATVNVSGLFPRVLANNGAGTAFATTNTSTTNCEAVSFLDIDGDGDLDIWSPGEQQMWHRNDGGGTYTAQSIIPGTSSVLSNGEGSSAADFTNDGRIDLIYNTGGGGSVCHAYVPNASFSYTRHTNVNTSFGLPQDVDDHENMEWAWGDFDNDGDVDVYVSGSSGLGLYRNGTTGASGTFSNVGASLGVTLTATVKGACWGDIDNDGDLDLVLAKDGNSVVYRNNGSPTFNFTAITAIAGVSNLNSTVGLEDFDLDGDLDIMTLQGQYYRNNLSGSALADFLRVRAVGGGAASYSPRTPIGARIRVYDKTGATLLATRWVSASQNNFQPYSVAHFGLDSGTEYVVKVLFPSSQKEITVTNVVPSHTESSQGSTTLSNTLTVFELSDQTTYSACRAGATVVFYGESATASTVRQRSFELSGNSVGPEATSVGALGRELRWVSAENTSTGDTVVVLSEANVGGSQTYYRAWRYSSGTWTQDWVAGPYGVRYSQVRAVHMAKESTSGDLLVVYSVGTDDPVYRTYSGGVWAGPTNVFATDPGNTAEWIKLVPHPANDQVWLFYSDTSRDLHCVRWNGAGWDEGTTEDTLETSLQSNSSTGTIDLPVFDFAFEYTSYDMLGVWGISNTGDTAKYATKASASNTFGAATGFNPVSGGGIRISTVSLAPDRVSNRIAMAVMNTQSNGGSNEQLGGGVWDGGAWVNVGQIDATARDFNDGVQSRHRQLLVMEWVNNVAVIVYPDTDTGVVDWARWTAATGWVIQTDFAVAGMGQSESVLWWSDTQTQKLGCLVSDSNQDLYLLACDGFAWATTNGGSALETSLSTITNGTPFAVLKLQAGTGTPGLWVGGESTDWGDPHNWDDCSVPSAEAVTIPATATYFPVISGAESSVSTISIASGASLTVTGGGSITVTGGIAVNGTLRVDTGGTLTMTNGTSITVASGASVLGRGADATVSGGGAATITASDSSSGGFTIVPASGSTVDLKGTQVTSGRIIAANSMTLRLSSTDFSVLAPATTNFVDLTSVTTGNLNFRNLAFTRGSNVTAAVARNIAVTASTPAITVFGYSGNLGGETYDTDPTNILLWQNNCFGLAISGTTYWQYRRDIRIDHTKVGRGGLTNYPVFVTVTDPEMAAKAQADGDDFRFRDSDGNQLDHEIETWDTTTGELAAWIRIPSLSDKVDTRFTLEYGNPLSGNQQNASGVWDANYLAVWHLDDAPGGTAADSTGNGRNGTGVSLNAATGPFSGASNWVASAGGVFPRVQLSVAGDFPVTSASYEVWVRTNSTATDGAMVSYTSTARDNDFLLFNHKNVAPYVRGNNAATGQNLNNNTWRHVAMTWSNADGYARVYVDGVAVYANTWAGGQTLGPTGGLVLGQEQDSVLGNYAAGQALVGNLDEFRLSNIARSEPWIQTQYNMGADPATFSIVSAEENVSPNMLDIPDYLPGVGETLTISGHQVDGFNRAINTHADHRGTLSIPAFLGTINIDGIRFAPPSTATGISVALGATGTVNFHNCAFIDPGNGMSTTAAGTARAVISSSGATRNASFCTIDSSNAGTAGFTAATSCIFTASLTTGAAGQRATHVIDFNNRDLRPTHAMLGDAAFAAARHATYTKDLDGRTRSATTRIGAWENRSSGGMVVANSDITNGTGIGSLINFTATPANNTLGNVFYQSGSDGTTCYLSVITRTTLAVQYVASWSGSKAGMPAHVQCSDITSQYWIYVPYDSDGDGSYNQIRRLKHTVATSLTDSGNQTFLSASGTALDLTSNGGWNGIMSLQNSFTTGVTNNEHQVSIATPAGFGGIHVWYVNKASTSGTFWPTADFTGTEHRAADSYAGNAGFYFNPNSYAQPLVGGTPASGTILLTRMADGSDNETLVRMNRNTTATFDPSNTYTGGTSPGDTVTGVPFALFEVGGRMAVQRTDTAGSVCLQWTTLSGSELEVSTPTGMIGSIGVPQVAFNKDIGVAFVPLAPDTGGCFGGIAATEYSNTLDGNNAFALLDSSYTFNSSKMQYDDDTGTPGSFDGGVAQTVGAVTRIAYAPTPATKTVVFAGTDAGLLYCWEAGGVITTTSTARKGQLIEGFPMRIEAGRITAINFVAVTDLTLLAKINTTAATNVLAVFTDRGQIVIVRIPEIP